MKRFGALLLVLVAPPATAAETSPSATVALSERLSRWKEEIEAARGTRVVLARIYIDAARNEIILPDDAEERPVLRRYFLNPAFVAEFVHMHAATLTHQEEGRLLHFVLLNMARAGEWGAQEEAVIGHEFGHIWLFVNNYPAPAFEGRPDSCIAIQAGDAVQHVLIRAELERRGVDWMPYWQRNLQTQLEALEAAGPQELASVPFCRRLSMLTQWVDARLSRAAASWEQFKRYEATMERSFPELRRPVEEIAALLAAADLADVEAYAAALRAVLVRMHALQQAPGASAN